MHIDIPILAESSSILKAMTRSFCASGPGLSRRAACKISGSGYTSAKRIMEAKCLAEKPRPHSAPRGVSVPLRFQREGIKYNELSEEEKEQWDALDWDEDGVVPDRVEPEVVNKWL